MAFFTIEQLAVDLPTGYDSGKVDRLLLQLEAELKSIGIVFDDPSASTQKLLADREGQSIFEFTSAKTITSITRKIKGSTSSTTLIEDTDYVISQHPNISGYYYRLELLDRNLYYPEYLEVAAKFGLYIDCSSDSAFETKLLRSICIDWLNKQLTYAETGNQSVVESRLGDSMIRFNDRQVQNSVYWANILEDSDFQQRLNYFRV